ncbi:MAG: tetratricopeptide repeat protein [Terriglobia bacterium]
MGFNKTKTIEAAQKRVLQGKLKEAVSEYLKIHTADPKDQNILNTLGDLYVRLQNIPEALNFFSKLADMYVSDGFLVRGIAMHKKIAKLDPTNIYAMERLGDLYTMQGLVREARAQYVQLAEAHLKADRGTEAMAIMQKLLDLDPDNLRIQERLASLYQRHGQPQQAAGIYRQLAERLLQKGQVEESLKWLQEAVRLAPDNVKLLLLQARALQQAGQSTEARSALEKIPHLEENPEAVEFLLSLHLEADEVEAAERLAEKLFAAEKTRFGGLLLLAQHATRRQEGDRALALLKRIAQPALEYDPLRLQEALRALVSLLEDSPEATELLVQAARQTGNHSALVEGLSHQAQAACRGEDFARAKHLYAELVSLEPHNPEFAEQLKRVQEQLGTPAERAAVEELPAEAELVEAPSTEEELDEETQAYVNSTLTDVDLFSSYGMTDKAIELAEQVVARIPGHLGAYEKLLDMYLGSGNDRGVVKIGHRLEALYRQANNEQRAEEVAHLAGRYAEKVGIEVPTQAPEEAALHEVDLTAEWAALSTGEAAALEVVPAETPEAPAPAFNPAEASEEIDFYLNQGLIEEAGIVLAGYEQGFPTEPILAELRARVEAAATAPPAETPAAEAEPAEVAPPETPAAEAEPIEVAPAETPPVEAEPAEVAPAETPAAEAEPIEVAPAETPPVEAEPAEVAPVEEQESYKVVLEEQPDEGAPAATPMSADEFFSDMADQIDAAVATAVPESDAVAPPPPPAAATPAPVPAPVAAKEEEPMSVLTEVFEQFKQAVGEDEEIEDIETHYNLGIAYKEMGLLDEAISEFQKVSRAAQKQQSYLQLFQSCNLLGLCFMAKGLPQLAVRWYERALKVPDLDEESALALRYDMGVAHEQAGNRKEALGCYLEVYGTNVDYRNVSERIRQLEGA